MSHVTILGVELWVFETVMAHFGVLVVDGVDKYKDDRDNDHRDCHESRYEGKIVLWNESKQKTCQDLGNLGKKKKTVMTACVSI